MLKACHMWFSTREPHLLASRPTLDILVPGASAYSVSDTEVTVIMYRVGDPMANPRNDLTLCTFYLVAWKEGWVKKVRLCPLPTHPPSISTSMHMPPL